VTFLLLAVLAAAATAFVLQPVFSGPETAPRRETDRTVLRLQEKRDQLLLTLAELDFERDAGKIAPQEHAESRASVLAQAAEVTAQLDALERRSPDRHRSPQEGETHDATSDRRRKPKRARTTP
jgi:uncharacterized protein with PIN domain